MSARWNAMKVNKKEREGKKARSPAGQCSTSHSLQLTDNTASPGETLDTFRCQNQCSGPAWSLVTLNSGDLPCLLFLPLQLTQCHWTPQENWRDVIKMARTYFVREWLPCNIQRHKLSWDGSLPQVRAQHLCVQRDENKNLWFPPFTSSPVSPVLVWDKHCPWCGQQQEGWSPWSGPQHLHQGQL